MRILPLLCGAFLLAACGPGDDTRVANEGADTTAAAPAEVPAAPAASGAASKLVGTWEGRGWDAGDKKGTPFTAVRRLSDDGTVTGTITIPGSGTKYNFKTTSVTESTFVQESEPHRSASLKAEVVTRTEAKFAGDSMWGTYEARATKGGKTLRGRFVAKRTSDAAP